MKINTDHKISVEERDQLLKFMESKIKNFYKDGRVIVENNCLKIKNNLLSGSLFLLGEFYNWNILNEFNKAEISIQRDGVVVCSINHMGFIVMNLIVLSIIFTWNFLTKYLDTTSVGVEKIIDSFNYGLVYALLAFPLLAIIMLFQILIINFRFKQFIGKILNTYQLETYPPRPK